jgi:hypothetical protein
MPAAAIPPSRAPSPDHLASPYTGDDGSLMLAAYEGWHADAFWLTFGCDGLHGCQRRVVLGIRPAIARFGRTTTVRGIARRLRCSNCGGRNIGVQITADTRGTFTLERDGPAPETRADFAGATQWLGHHRRPYSPHDARPHRRTRPPRSVACRP